MRRYPRWPLFAVAVAVTGPALALFFGTVSASGQPAVLSASEPTRAALSSCPAEMALVDAFCVDRFEASLERLDAKGESLGLQPHNEAPLARPMKAVSARGNWPQAHVSQEEAVRACDLAGKRLCTDAEWLRACRGAPSTRYPYGEKRRVSMCNDRGVEPLAVVFGRATSKELWGFEVMNDPRLSLVPGGLSPSGLFGRCRSEQEVFDMVGNLHEWTADPEGTMRGGYYLDTTTLGEGCDYAAVGHDVHYRDYSTGFRCCRDRG